MIATARKKIKTDGTVRPPLSSHERERLDRLEATISGGSQSFIAIGEALQEIRDSRLYREVFSDFGEYCRKRWDITRARAYQLITAVEIRSELSTTVDTAPTNERQIRALASFSSPELRLQAWKAALEAAPEVDGEKRVTGAIVSKAVREIRVQKIRSLQTPRIKTKGSWELTKRLARSGKTYLGRSAGAFDDLLNEVDVPPEYQGQLDEAQALTKRLKHLWREICRGIEDSAQAEASLQESANQPAEVSA